MVSTTIQVYKMIIMNDLKEYVNVNFEHKEFNEKNEFYYYIALLLTECDNLDDIFNVFPEYSHHLISNAPSENYIKNNKHKEAIIFIENKYPKGAALLRECSLLSLIE